MRYHFEMFRRGQHYPVPLASYKNRSLCLRVKVSGERLLLLLFMFQRCFYDVSSVIKACSWHWFLILHWCLMYIYKQSNTVIHSFHVYVFFCDVTCEDCNLHRGVVIFGILGFLFKASKRLHTAFDIPAFSSLLIAARVLQFVTLQQWVKCGQARKYSMDHERRVLDSSFLVSLHHIFTLCIGLIQPVVHVHGYHVLYHVLVTQDFSLLLLVVLLLPLILLRLFDNI